MVTALSVACNLFARSRAVLNFGHGNLKGLLGARSRYRLSHCRASASRRQHIAALTEQRLKDQSAGLA